MLVFKAELMYVPNQNGLPHPCLLGGPKEGGNATSPLHSRGSPNKGEQNQNWLPHPYLLGGSEVGGNATSPLHSRGSPTKGTKSKHKKTTTKNPKTNFAMLLLTLPRFLQTAHTRD